MKTSMRSRVLSAIGFLLLCGVGGIASAADKATIIVNDAWVRMPAASKTTTAAYMVIENKTASARSVVSVTSPDAEKIELHEMKMTGTMMSMAPVAKIDIPANGRATLAPNGLHLMVFGLKSKLAEGGKVSFMLKLDDGSTVAVNAGVRSSQ